MGGIQPLNTQVGRHPIWHALDRLQMDLRAANARLVEVRAQVAALGLKDEPEPRYGCPECGVTFHKPELVTAHRERAAAWGDHAPL